MLTVIPFSETLLQRTADQIVQPGISDYSALTVVSPSARFHLFLREELARRLTGPFFPPRFRTIDSLIDELFSRAFPGTTTADEIESAFLIYLACQELFPAGVYAGGADIADFPTFFPRARQIRDAVEEILTEGGDFSSLDRDSFRLFSEMGDYHDAYKTFIGGLPRLTGRYLELQEERRISSRGRRYRAVAALGRDGRLRGAAEEKWLFCGFHALNKCESSILSWFFQNTDARMIIQTDTNSWRDPASPFHLQYQSLKTLPLTLPAHPEAGPPVWKRLGESLRLYRVAGREEAMIRIQRLIEDHRQQRPLEDPIRIGIALPDASALLPFVQNVVSRFPDSPPPFNITLAYPFDRTPLYQFLQAVLTVPETAVNDEIAAAAYLSLIRHPYAKLPGGELLRSAVHRAERLLVRFNLDTFAPADLLDRMRQEMAPDPLTSPEAETAIIDALEQFHHSHLLPAECDAGTVIRFLLQTIERLETHAGSDGHLFFPEYLATARGELERQQRFVADNPEAFAGAKFFGLASFIRHQLQGCRIYFEGSPLKGIQIMGMLEFRGLDFDELIIVDAVEGVLPPSRKYDPLLPYDIRRLLGIRDHSDWEQLFALHFFSLAASCRHVHVVIPVRSPAGDPAEQSRFIERIVFETAKTGISIASSTPAICAAFPSRKPARTVVKTADLFARIGGLSLSPSSLDTYIHCPLRFYYERVLRIEEKPEITAEADAGAFGSIAHDALQEIYEQVCRTGGFPNATEVARIIAARYRAHHFRPDRGLERLRYWLLTRKTSAFIEFDRERIGRDQVMVGELESAIKITLPVAGSLGDAVIKGRIDRIEKEGAITRVIDYKTGAPFSVSVAKAAIPDLNGLASLPPAGYIDRLGEFARSCRSFQILLYLAMLQKNRGIPYTDLDAAYVFLKDSDIRLKYVFGDPHGKHALSPGQKPVFMERFLADLEAILLDLHTRDRFHANPGEPKYCSYCSFAPLCGYW